MKRPLTPQEVEQVKAAGYDVSNYRGEAVEVPDDVASTAQTSALGAGAKTFAASAAPTAAGGAVFMPAFTSATGLAAPLGPYAPIAGVIAGLAASYGAGKLTAAAQHAVIPKEWEEAVATAQQEHPVASKVGQLAALPLGGLRPSPTMIGRAATGAGKLGAEAVGTVANRGAGTLGKFGSTLTAEEAQALKLTAGGAALGAGQEAVVAPLEGREVTLPHLFEAAATGGAFTHPTTFAQRFYKFPAPLNRTVTDPTRLAATLTEGEPTATAGRETLTPLKLVEPVPDPAAKLAVVPPAEPKPAPAAKPIDPVLDIIQKRDKARQLFTALGDNPAQAADKAKIGNLLEEIDAQIAADPRIKERVETVDRFRSEDAKAKAKREAEGRDAPEEEPILSNEPSLGSSPLGQWVRNRMVTAGIPLKTTKEYIQSLVSDVITKWNIHVSANGGLVNDKNQPIRGTALLPDPVRQIVYNPELATADVPAGHEVTHYIREETERAEAAGNKQAAELRKLTDELSRPGFEADQARRKEAGLAPHRDLHEFIAKEQGFEFLKQQLNLAGETKRQKWWNDLRAVLKTKWSKQATVEDLRRALNFELVHKGGMGKYVGKEGPLGPVAGGKPVVGGAPSEVREERSASEEDVQRYKDIQAKMLDIMRTNPDNPELAQLFKENEQIKNKYGGMPPTTGRNAPEEGDINKVKKQPHEGRYLYRPFGLEQVMRGEVFQEGETERAKAHAAVKPGTVETEFPGGDETVITAPRIEQAKAFLTPERNAPDEPVPPKRAEGEQKPDVEGLKSFIVAKLTTQAEAAEKAGNTDIAKELRAMIGDVQKGRNAPEERYGLPSEGAFLGLTDKEKEYSRNKFESRAKTIGEAVKTAYPDFVNKYMRGYPIENIGKTIIEKLAKNDPLAEKMWDALLQRNLVKVAGSNDWLKQTIAHMNTVREDNGQPRIERRFAEEEQPIGEPTGAEKQLIEAAKRTRPYLEWVNREAASGRDRTDAAFYKALMTNDLLRDDIMTEPNVMAALKGVTELPAPKPEAPAPVPKTAAVEKVVSDITAKPAETPTAPKQAKEVPFEWPPEISGRVAKEGEAPKPKKERVGTLSMEEARLNAQRIRERIEREAVPTKQAAELTPEQKYDRDLAAAKAKQMADDILRQQEVQGGIEQRARKTRTRPVYTSPEQSKKSVEDEAARYLEERRKKGRFAEEEGPAKTDTPEFKNWFGNSKVVDDEGKPLVVYHSTNTMKLGKEKTPGKYDYEWIPKEINVFTSGHFGTAKQAEQHAYGADLMKEELAPATYPVYLKISNPKRISDAKNNWYKEIELAKKEGYDGIVYKNEFEPDAPVSEEVTKFKETQQFVDNELKKAGIEHGDFMDVADAVRKKLPKDIADRVMSGIVNTMYGRDMMWNAQRNKAFKEGHYADSYIPFYPEQVKSASGNRGTYDPTNPDIRHASDESPQAFIPGLAATFDKVKRLDTELAQAGVDWQARKDSYWGKAQTAIRALAATPSSVLDRAIAKMQTGTALSPAEDKAALPWRQYFKWNADERTAIGMKPTPTYDPNYVPQILNRKWTDILVNHPESPEAQNGKALWANRVVTKSGGKILYGDAYNNITDYIGAIGSPSTNYKSVNFRAIRNAVQYPLPEGMRENSAREILARFGRRSAADMALYRELESQPSIQQKLGLNDPVTGKKPRVAPGETDFSVTKEVQNMMSFVTGAIDESAIRHPVFTSITRLANNLLLGPGTGLRDTASIPVFAVPYLNKFSDLMAFANGVTKFRENAAAALDTAAVQPHLDRVMMSDIADSPSRFLDVVRKAATLARTGQGREAIENFNREVVFSIGKELARSNIAGAKAGHKGSKQYLDRLSTLVEGDPTKLTGKDLDTALNQMAKNFVDANQGTYGGSGLPAGVVRGPLAPFLALQKWSIEKSNTIFKDVVKPFYTGENRIPMLTYMLGSVLTGAAIQSLNKLLTNKTASDPTWKEALDKGDASAITSQIATLMQLSSYGGIVGDTAKLASDALKGKTPRNPLSFPAFSSSIDAAESIKNAAAAINDGEPATAVLTELATYLMKHNIQATRMAAGYVDKEETERSQKFRDIRVFKELEHEPFSTVVEPNRFEGLTSRQFKRTGDIGEAVRLLPELTQRAMKSGDYEDMSKKFRALKGNSYQTMPSLEDTPMEFQRYYQFLERTQGKEAADARLENYVRQRMVNQVKSSMVPSF